MTSLDDEWSWGQVRGSGHSGRGGRGQAEAAAVRRARREREGAAHMERSRAAVAAMLDFHRPAEERLERESARAAESWGLPAGESDRG
ncbi:MAG: hypothetical protein F4Y03_00455 [Alphaproteobacteria bacterium]|nr:hypothetical protein [Alphaproteobacteria bacterium]